MRALATPGPLLCMEQSPEFNRRRLRHQKLWGCLPTWTSVTKRVSSRNKDISYHPSSRTRSSSLRWLRQCSGWQSPWWCQRHFLRPIAARCHPPHLNQGAVDLSSRYYNWKSLFQAPHSPLRRSRSRSARLPTLIQTELMSPLQRGNRLAEPSRSDFPLNSLSVAIRPWRAVPRMVSHPPKCARSQRPRRPRLAPQPGPQRQPSRKLGLNCSKRTSQQSRRSMPGSSNSRREK